MRRIIKLDRGWTFQKPDKPPVQVNIPPVLHGTGRWTGVFSCVFPMPEFQSGDWVFLRLRGVNGPCRVVLNDIAIATYDGDFAIQADITEHIRDINQLKITVGTGPSGWDAEMFRDAELLILDSSHFDLNGSGGGLHVLPTVDGADGRVEVRASVRGFRGRVTVELLDRDGNTVARGNGPLCSMTIPGVHLWDGVRDPYLYTALARLSEGGTVLDEVSVHFGFRNFRIDPREGFFLNGRSYPLRGVSLPRDAAPEENMDFLLEMGANAVFLSGAENDPQFYDLCDERGLLTWVEVFRAVRHTPDGGEAAAIRAKELVAQCCNHPSVIAWGLSDRAASGKADLRMVNDLCHQLDGRRVTVLICENFGPAAHVADAVVQNVKLGRNSGFGMDLFHALHSKLPLGCLVRPEPCDGWASTDQFLNRRPWMWVELYSLLSDLLPLERESRQRELYRALFC